MRRPVRILTSTLPFALGGCGLLAEPDSPSPDELKFVPSPTTAALKDPEAEEFGAMRRDGSCPRSPEVAPDEFGTIFAATLELLDPPDTDLPIMDAQVAVDGCDNAFLSAQTFYHPTRTLRRVRPDGTVSWTLGRWSEELRDYEGLPPNSIGHLHATPWGSVSILDVVSTRTLSADGRRIPDVWDDPAEWESEPFVIENGYRAQPYWPTAEGVVRVSYPQYASVPYLLVEGGLFEQTPRAHLVDPEYDKVFPDDLVGGPEIREKAEILTPTPEGSTFVVKQRRFKEFKNDGIIVAKTFHRTECSTVFLERFFDQRFVTEIPGCAQSIGLHSVSSNGVERGLVLLADTTGDLPTTGARLRAVVFDSKTGSILFDQIDPRGPLVLGSEPRQGSTSLDPWEVAFDSEQYPDGSILWVGRDVSGAFVHYERFVPKTRFPGLVE